jgi:hypothetical protein
VTTPIAFPVDQSPLADAEYAGDELVQSELEKTQDSIFLDCGRDI